MGHQLKITLQDITPPIWRRVVVPSELTLREVHCVIQIAMGWEDCHLHEFTIKRQRYSSVPDSYGLADDLALSEDEVTLLEVAKPRSKFTYLYDFGDSWRHDISVEKVDGELTPSVPVCLAGARACPPEDCGGSWGYEDKLGALFGDDKEAAEEVCLWMGDFDPELFEIELVNQRLEAMLRPEPAKKKLRNKKARKKKSTARRR